MKKLIFAALLIGGTTSVANAQLSVSPGDQAAPAGASVVTFDSPLPSGFSLTGGQIDQGTTVDNNKAPAGDTTKYLAVLGGNSATVTAAQTYKTVGFYWGSIGPSDVATIFDGLGNLITTITAGQAQGSVPVNGASDNYVSYTINPATVANGIKSVVFSAGSNSFELDDVAFSGTPGNPASVPEPGMMALFALAVGGLWMLNKRRVSSRTFA